MKQWETIVLLVVSLGLAACQAPKAVHEVKPSGFLGPEVVAKLKPGGPEGPALLYKNPKVKWASYDKMLLDPVTFWRAPGAPDQGISQAERQKLVDYFYQVIYRAMSKQIIMVNTPGPGVIRVQVALTKADRSAVALDVISSVVPQAAVLSSLKDAVTGKPAFVGEARVAAKLSDSVSGELLGAWVGRPGGGQAARRGPDELLGRRGAGHAFLGGQCGLPPVQAAEEARLPTAQELAYELSNDEGGVDPRPFFCPLFSGGLNSSAVGGNA